MPLWKGPLDGRQVRAFAGEAGLATEFLRTVFETTDPPVVSELRQFMEANHATGSATTFFIRVQYWSDEISKRHSTEFVWLRWRAMTLSQKQKSQGGLSQA